MEHNLLVIDVGTQSLRASIVSSEGEMCAFKQMKYKTAYLSPKEGFAEQSADFYVDQICLATKQLKEQSPSLMESIEGMVVVDFRDSSVILDENNKPIRNSILWLDQRVTLLNGKNFKLWEKIVFGIIGMSDTVKYNSERTSSFWIMENEPENWKRMKTYAPLGSYFNYKITDKLTISSADCIGHYPIDFKNGKWLPLANPKWDIFKIPKNALPKLTKVGDEIGRVSEEFSKKSGIPSGTRLFASASDKACETFGNGCIHEDQASISLGTACTIDVVSHKYSEPEKFLPSYQAPYPGSYDLEVQIYRGLWMVRWFIDEFGYQDKIEAEKMNMSVEDYLEMKISTIKPGCDGLVLQPYWGPGLKRPNAKGSIIGFSAAHTKYHIYRAILEGIAFSLREGLDEIMKKTKTKPKYLVISGGGSKNLTLIQIIADIFGIDAIQAPSSESSTIGGAMSGFLSLGVFKNPEEAISKMVKQGNVTKYRPQVHKQYDELYKNVYLKMYPKLKDVYSNIKYFCLKNQ